MLEKESLRGGYTSDSETSSTGGDRNTDVGDKMMESSMKYRSSVYIKTNGNGVEGEDPTKVCKEKSGGYSSDSEASTTATETNVIDGPKKVCRRQSELPSLYSFTSAGDHPGPERRLRTERQPSLQD